MFAVLLFLSSDGRQVLPHRIYSIYRAIFLNKGLVSMLMFLWYFKIQSAQSSLSVPIRNS